jgi:FkbM family methyltransferase
MLDVGAHYGESHRWYLKRGWNVLAFEPDPANRAKIRLNVGPGRLTILDCAVSDYQLAAAEYFASSESTGISALAPFVPTHRPVCTVAVRTLSSVLSESTIDRCDFLKIDTEGHDLFVLRGFPWDRLIPDAVLCEFENRKTIPLGYTHQALGDFLLEQGYAVYLSEWAPIVRYGADHSWRRLVRYPAPLLDGAGWGNFVAFRDDKPLPDRVKRWLEKRQSQ